MQLKEKTIWKLAQMICGEHGTNPKEYSWPHFIYRSSSKLTQFFTDNCDLPYQHEGSREGWVVSILTELNKEEIAESDFPSPQLIRVIRELLESVKDNKPEDHQAAM